MPATMACSDRGSVIVGLTPESEADCASEKRTMRAYPQEIIVIDPAVTLKFVTSQDAKVLCCPIPDPAFDVKQPVMVEGDTAKIVEDVYFLGGVIVEVITHGGGEFGDRALCFLRISAEGRPGNVEPGRNHTHVDHWPDVKLILVPAICIHALPNRLTEVPLNGCPRYISLASEYKTTQDGARAIPIHRSEVPHEFMLAAFAAVKVLDLESRLVTEIKIAIETER